MAVPRAHLRSASLARAALAGRLDVKAAVLAARARGATLRIVGGAVRDAFLGRTGGDLDLALAAADAAGFAEALAERLGTRAVPMGRPGTRLFRIPAPPREIDVWEIPGSFEEDRDRRDFTVNALAFEVPGWRLDAPEGALADLAARRLRLPRPGVLLEDPLRVLRAARFRAELPGFRVDPSALPELRRAAPLLPAVPAERRLYEWDRILSAGPAHAAGAVRDLDRWGALSALLPGSRSAERRAGIARLARLPRGASPAAARAALLAPLGSKARGHLAAWKASRDEQRMTAAVLSLPRAPRGAAPGRAVLARTVRHLTPWVADGSAVLTSSPWVAERRLGAALARLGARSIARMVRPRQYLEPAEVAGLLGIAPGPLLGEALAALDDAVAAGRIRSRAAARELVARISD